MNIGSLRHRISLHYIAESEEVGGADTYRNLTLITYLWAKIEALSGLTRFDTKQIGEEITHRITIRFYPGLSAQNWLKYNDPAMGTQRNYQIVNIRNNDERNQYLELLVKEVFLDTEDLNVGDGSVNDPLET